MRDRTTTYEYDKNNRVTAIDHPGDLGTEQFGYDDVGNLLWKRDGNSAVTIYKYDELNRLTDVWYNYTGSLSPITYPQGSGNVHYAYDGGSRLRTSMTDSVGESGYEYDIQDRLVSYTPPLPSNHAPVEYTYNALGQKTSVTNGSFAVDYEYYANGWLKAVTDGTNPYAEYTYDQVGNRTRVDLGNTTYTTYDYDGDPRYRVGAVKHYDASDTLLASPGILYASRDSAGNPLSMQDWNGTITYGYDANSRLTSAGAAGFGYDWVGNRLNPPADPNPMEYNNADQLVTWPNQHQYTYLGTGSLYQQKDGQGTVQKTYSYTAANLLSSVVHAGIGTSSMTLDADGNRVSFTSSEDSGTTQFVYDVTAGIPAVIEETGPVYYIREPSGALIARIDGETVNYYHFDALGSTRLLTDSSGAVTDTYSYDAWANAAHDYGSTEQPYQFVGQLGYYTHVQDGNMNLLQLGVRFYDPAVGRFTQTDELREGNSHYLYVHNMPQAATDPTGLKTFYCYEEGGVPTGTHAWLCHNGNCYGCYPQGMFNDGGLMRDRKNGIPNSGTARCYEVTEHPTGFDGCLDKQLPRNPGKPRQRVGSCTYNFPFRQCASWVADTMAGCGICVKGGCPGLGFIGAAPTQLPDMMGGCCTNKGGGGGW